MVKKLLAGGMSADEILEKLKINTKKKRMVVEGVSGESSGNSH